MAERIEPIGGGSQIEDLRQRRLGQLRQMSAEEFAAEVRRHQAARWPRMRLLEHTKEHRRDFEELLGQALTPSEFQELSHTVLHAWERLFTGLDRRAEVWYAFVGRWSVQRGILVVVTRAGRIRTTMPMDMLEPWLRRRTEMIEVTDRAKSLSL